MLRHLFVVINISTVELCNCLMEAIGSSSHSDFENEYYFQQSKSKFPLSQTKVLYAFGNFKTLLELPTIFC